MRTRRSFLTGLFASAVSSVGASDEPQPLPTDEVAPGVFVAPGPHELASPENADHISNAGFIVGDDAVAVIDTGGSFLVGRQLLAAIRSRTQKPIRYVVNTHDHPDHILGNGALLGPGVTILGHHRLPEALAARATAYLEATRNLIGDIAFAGTRVIPPTRLVGDRLTLDLGNRPLLLEAWPVAHTDTDLTLLDERTGTWFLGDLLFSGHVPALDGSLKGWLAVIGDLRKRTAARAVPGHGPASLPWPSALDPLEHYLRILFQDVQACIRDGRTMREAAASAALSERGKWSLFDDFNARNATTAFHELEWAAP